MKSEQDGPGKFDEKIDAALNLLSEAQPPAAMLSRVQRSLETAAATSQQVRSGRRLLIPAAGVAMAALAFFAIFIQMHRTQEDRTFTVETARVATTVPAPQRIAAVPRGSHEGKRSVHLYTERRSHANRKNRHATNLLSYPLTRQERLLVRFVQTAKPADLQALNPEYQAKVQAQQDAEFAAYLNSGGSSSTQGSATATGIN